ncbi:MAG: glycosyltransferase family 4 protein [Acidimicrobiia bacterium]
MTDRTRLALVPPRYGEDVVGGAEVVLRQAAHGLAARGWDVEILTTCSRDHYTWANEYPAGTSTDGAVTVRRFPVVRDADRAERDRLDRRLTVGLSLDPAEQLTWANGNMRVPDLVHHLVTAGNSYRAVVFSPYLAWTTLAGVATVPERAVVIPCLHDEPSAYLEVFRPVLTSPAQVWFMSEPEQRLAQRLGEVAPHHVTGEGVLVPDSYDPQRFRDKYGLTRPFVLFAGRREPLKGWNDLLAGLDRARHLGADLDLVSFGVGWMPPPPAIAGRVIDLGYLPQEDVGDAFAAAAAYIQPSAMESFSRTIMEAWLAGTPVIASGRSDVVRWHCERSGAGLVYEDIYELAQCLALVADAPEALRPLAAAGRDYVLTHYTWDVALDRMEKALEDLP